MYSLNLRLPQIPWNFQDFQVAEVSSWCFKVFQELTEVGTDSAKKVKLQDSGREKYRDSTNVNQPQR